MNIFKYLFSTTKTESKNEDQVKYLSVLEELKQGVKKPSEYQKPSKSLLKFEIKSKNIKEPPNNDGITDQLMLDVSYLENIIREKNRMSKILFDRIIEHKDTIIENQALCELLHDKLNNMVEDDHVFPWQYNQIQSKQLDFII